MRIRAVLKFKAKLLVALAFAASLVLYPLIAPRVIGQLIRLQVSAQVFKVYGLLDEKNEHAIFGTGSIIQVPGVEGKTYLITNRHVCENSTDGTVVVEQDGNRKRLKIVKMAEDTDLCAIETIKGYTGLKVDTDYHSADEVMVIGHPSGYPITKTVGEIIGYENVVIANKITKPEEEADCKKWKNTSVKEFKDDGSLDDDDDEDSTTFTYKYPIAITGPKAVGAPEKTAKFCVTVEPRSTLATPQVMPGSSGSPLVTWYGEVVGVVFATNSRDSWVRAVALPKLVRFLKELP